MGKKVAIVTGSSNGIGRKIVEQLAKLGIKVVVNYNNNLKEAQNIVKDIEKKGGQAIAIQANVASISDLENLFEKTIEHYGKIDILVNNAGYMNNMPIEEVSEEEFDKHFLINVKGSYFACQLAMKHMQDNGKIINFSTSVTKGMFPSYSLYGASKGAVEQMTRQLAKEFGKKSITINAIAPGSINTELFRKGKSAELIQSHSKMNSFNRLGEPEDIADMIELLVSDKSHWMTGQTINVNGGFN